MRRTIIFLSAALLSAALLSSCKKEDPKPVEGCKDPTASNYNADAEKNCCCEYEADLSIWYRLEEYYVWKFNQEVDSFYFYMDGKLIGKEEAHGGTWSGVAPTSCNTNSLFKTKVKLSGRTGDYKLSITSRKGGKDHFDNMILGTYTIEAGRCYIVQFF